MADLYFRRGDTTEAEAIYRKTIADIHDNPWVLINWARFLRDTGRPGDAEGVYRAVLALKEGDDEVAEVKQDAREELKEMIRTVRT